MPEVKLYPLVFNPIYKEKIWGGNKLQQVLGKNCNETKQIGESWELSGVENNLSIVRNGDLKGLSILDICDKYGASVLGGKVVNEYGNQFPLLIKFIDATDKLSVQVHPGNELARKNNLGLGKAEMWYIIETEPDSEIIYGLSKNIDVDIYQRVAEGRIEEKMLNNIKVNPHESFYIEPGTVHAIGAGILLAEIQQTSDITYRIYDYDRIDSQGEKRKLHTKLAAEAIKLDTSEKYLTELESQGSINLFSTPYFITNRIVIEDSSINKDYSTIDSFVIFIIIEGELTIHTKNNLPLQVKKGEVILIPNNIEEISLVAFLKTIILETYI